MSNFFTWRPLWTMPWDVIPESAVKKAKDVIPRKKKEWEAHQGSDLMNTEDAAAYLHLGVSTLERWRVEGNGPPYVKLGRGKRGRVVYSRSMLDAYIESSKFNSTSEYITKQQVPAKQPRMR